MVFNTRSHHSLRAGERGVAATELALAIPMLTILLLGGIDLARYMIVWQKIDRAAYTIADIVAQSEMSPTASELNQILLAAQKLVEPYVYTPHGRVIVSSVYRDVGSTVPKIRWQYTHKNGGTLSRSSKVGTLNNAATLPTILTMAEKENVIVTEIFYDYTAAYPEDFLKPGEIYNVAYYKPRLGDLTTAPK